MGCGFSESQHTQRAGVIHQNETGHHGGGRHRSEAPTVDAVFGLIAAHHDAVVTDGRNALPTGIRDAGDVR